MNKRLSRSELLVKKIYRWALVGGPVAEGAGVYACGIELLAQIYGLRSVKVRLRSAC
jgi:hypothetical protein